MATESTFADIVATNYNEIARNFKTGLKSHGYIFDEEHLLPFTSKCCAKIWPLKNDLQKIKKDDYAIISLLNNRKRHMFKFIYNGNTWVIDDYYVV